MNTYHDLYRIGARYVAQQKGVSQKALAIDADVTQGTISKLLAGKNEGTARLREAVAASLGVPYPKLIEIGRRVVAGEAVADEHRAYDDDLSMLFGAFPLLRDYLEMAQRALRMGDFGMAKDILGKISKAIESDNAPVGRGD